MTATTITIIECPGCRSPNVLHRGGAQRQCALCRFRFDVTPTGEATSTFHRWLEGRKATRGKSARPDRRRQRSTAHLTGGKPTSPRPQT
jgi:LSD1 subclass zinc finger protein